MKGYVLLTNRSDAANRTECSDLASQTVNHHGPILTCDRDRVVRAERGTVELKATLGQLRAVAAEFFMAVSNGPRGELESTKRCLQQMAAILHDAIKKADFPRRTRANAVRSGLAPWQMRQLTAHIDANLHATIWTKDLAALINLSPSHFSRAFKRSFADTPHRYVVRRRLERAQGLMLKTDRSLVQIAMECGFADQPHLNKIFRRLVDETPRKWRRAHPPVGGYRLTLRAPRPKRLERFHDADAEGPRASGGH